MPETDWILVIDDDAVFQRRVKRLAEGLGFTCSTAVTAESGLRTANLLEPDVVVVGSDLPDRSTLELLGDLNAGTDPARAVVVASRPSGDAGFASLALERGASHVFDKEASKPFIRGLLINTMKDLRRRQRIDPGRRDPVTGLLAGRHFRDTLHRQMARHVSSGCFPWLVSLDIQGLARLNSAWGVSRCDEFLKRVGAVLGEEVGAAEAVGRLFGGHYLAARVEAPERWALRLRRSLRDVIEEFTESPSQRPHATLTTWRPEGPDVMAEVEDVVLDGDLPEDAVVLLV